MTGLGVRAARPTAVLRRRLRLKSGPARAWVRHTAPKIAAATVIDGVPGVWRSDRIVRTGTGVTVALLSRDSDGRRCVVKLPGNAEAIAALCRQDRVLAELRSNTRLAGWPGLLPHRLGHGEVAGHPFWMEDALPGTPVTVATLRPPGLLTVATRLIEDLHDRTGQQRPLTETTARSYVEDRIRRLMAHPRADGGHRAILSRLGAEVTASLTGCTTRTCWIHGDFWPGNLLADGGSVSGIVDWDQAAPEELPLHDLLHLHVLARRMRTGAELGEVVVQCLRGGVATAVDIAGDQLNVWLDGVPERTAVLLYWLRHVSLFINSEGHGDNPRWLRANVERVLDHI